MEKRAKFDIFFYSLGCNKIEVEKIFFRVAELNYRRERIREVSGEMKCEKIEKKTFRACIN